MLDVSTDFKRAVAKNTTFRIKATLVLADGTILMLTGEDFMMSGNTFERATSSVGSFDVGAAIIGKATLTLNNFGDKFSGYDFRDAAISAQVGVPVSTLEDGSETVEWVEMGVYNVEQPDSYANTIQLKCYDNLSSLEKAYSSVNTVYPATLAKIVADACSYCGVSLFTTTFPNSSYVVSERPDEDVTCLDIIAYAAQAAGCYAKADTQGRVCLQWYDTSALDALESLDGGLFTEPRDSADGGLFSDREYEVAQDGGTFGERTFAILTQHSQLMVSTDDVTITGVSVTAMDEQTEDDYHQGETYTVGTAGYTISISDNPLVLYGQAETVARQIAANIVGLTIRPFSSSTLCDPSLEAGDPVLVIDGKQNQYPTILTSQTIDLNGWAMLSCDAGETTERATSSAGAVLRVAHEVKDTATVAANAQFTANDAANAASAAQTAADNAAKVATNYLTFSESNGLDVGYAGTASKTRVKGDGVEVFDGNGTSALFAGVQDGVSVVRVGDASSGNVVMKSDGSVDIRTVWSTLGQSSLSAHFGYGETINAYGSLADAPYYDLGQRNDDPLAGGIGAYSMTQGVLCNASHYCSHAEGSYSLATGLASHAEGTGTRASGQASHAEGNTTNASGDASHAEGTGTIAAGANSHATGTYNVSNTGRIWQVGNGTVSARKDIAYLTTAGAMWIAGALTQNSDRRLKEHVDYLGEEAAEFVRNLHPALYIKDGERRVGFYAQDVAEADPWETVTVQAQHTDEGLGFDPLTLDYTALIAPLVAYCQQLERRIAELEAR